MADTERFECRLPKDVKALLERAVSLEGGSLNGFVASAIYRAATDTVSRHESTVVSARDWKRIMTALDEDDYVPTPENKGDRDLYESFRKSGASPS
ncbi:hypothetical protein BH11ARM2_BH11ARM2_37510 [soil metagenome]